MIGQYTPGDIWSVWSPKGHPVMARIGNPVKCDRISGHIRIVHSNGCVEWGDAVPEAWLIRRLGHDAPAPTSHPPSASSSQQGAQE